MIDKSKLHKATAVAGDVADMLNHIGWQERVKPQLVAERSKYQQLLTQLVLNPNLDPVHSKEQIAACIIGINIIIKAFESILQKGISAEAALKGALQETASPGL